MTDANAPVISPAAAAALRAARPGTRLLDVRAPGEFGAGHIPGAYNVPLDALAEYGPAIRAGVTEPVVLVCRSGQRARRAAVALRDAGMTDLHVLDGGMIGWTGAGLPVEDPPGQAGGSRARTPISLERQVRIVAGALAAAGGFLALFGPRRFAAVPAFVGSGLVFAGVTDTCAMGTLLARLPYNRAGRGGTGGDLRATVRALTTGAPPPA